MRIPEHLTSAVDPNTNLLYVGAPHTNPTLVMRDGVTRDISSAKLLPDGRFVEPVVKPVTTRADQMGNDLYIEEPDRSSGSECRWRSPCWRSAMARHPASWAR